MTTEKEIRELKDWVCELDGELANAIAHNNHLKARIRYLRKCLREVCAKMPRSYPDFEHVTFTVDVTESQLLRWRKACGATNRKRHARKAAPLRR